MGDEGCVLLRAHGKRSLESGLQEIELRPKEFREKAKGFNSKLPGLQSIFRTECLARQ